MTAKALIIDDEVDLCRLMQITLQKMAITADIAYDLATAHDLLKNNTYDFCLTDLQLPDGSGLELVKTLNAAGSTMPIAVITAHGNMDLAIEALKYGAFDFVNKPLELPRLRQLVEHTLKIAGDNASKNKSDKAQKTPAQLLLDERLIGQSPTMQQLKGTIIKLARSQAPVFLWGESGTGKEVVAKLIHDLSPRREGSFVPINCGAIPSELMESEFFGHKKGSFTGATADKKGLFQQADGGTLFLDEVADLPLAMQVKLLRAIQEKTVRAIGDTKEYAVDIRILSATHKNLSQLVHSGEFRQDLFYRINVIQLKLPTLNDRDADIGQLAQFFLAEIAKDWQMSEALQLSDESLTHLQAHQYKGNVRELRNILERAVTLAETSIIEAEHLGLPSPTAKAAAHSDATAKPSSSATPTSKPALSPSPHAALDKDKRVVAEPPQPQATATNQSGHPKAQTPSHHQPITQTAPHTPSKFGHSNNYASTHNHNQVVKLETSNPSLNNSAAPTKLGLGDLADVQSVSAQTTPSLPLTEALSQALPDAGLEAYLQEQERQMIIVALNKTNWNKTKAADLLKTSFRSLRYRMKKLEIEGGDSDD